jgi:hypothetical protein
VTAGAAGYKPADVQQGVQQTGGGGGEVAVEGSVQQLRNGCLAVRVKIWVLLGVDTEALLSAYLSVQAPVEC